MADDDPLPPTTWLRLPTNDRPAPQPPPPSASPPPTALPPAPARSRPVQSGAGSFSGARVNPATTHMRRQSQSRLLWAGVLAAVVFTLVALAVALPAIYLVFRG